MSSMTILFPNLQIIRSDIRPYIKWAVSLVTAYGHFNLPQGFVWVCISLHTLLPSRLETDLDMINCVNGANKVIVVCSMNWRF